MTERDSLTYAQPAGEPYAGVSETLSAVVFFAGDRAYKLKKPVSTSFLDFSTPHARAAACQRETELNRGATGERGRTNRRRMWSAYASACWLVSNCGRLGSLGFAELVHHVDHSVDIGG